MGLKSGSRDPGLDDDEEPDQKEDTAQHSDRTVTEGDEARSADQEPDFSSEGASSGSDQGDAGPQSAGTDERPSMSAIPYKLRREKVNEGREQVPYFLREEVIEEEDNLQDSLEEILDEHVYKSDYREATMVVAQRNPELVAEVLREWGYDLDSG
jgi:hypothetical protein